MDDDYMRSVSNQNKTHATRNIILLSIFIVVAISSLIVALSIMGGQHPVSTPVVENIVTGPVIVNSGSYEDYQFSVPSGASDVRVSGSFSVTNNGAIKVYVMDDANFVNWKDNKDYDAYYYSETPTGDIIATLPLSGTYHLVYDNISAASQKNIETTVDLVIFR